ncbi:MAG: ZIP family metal transporter [Candidatus Magasanikbacteria bacterium]|nr:ZIP family metal transporter [Candidatus Magasanikbacteria bacterium]USN52620.1 MAG: ZIP family metal transporter [Candidatus Nomurabacteria bacterium]HPF95712.1 ZIP family metal transporter [bacterium]
MVFLFIILAFAMIMLGGLVGLKFRDRSHLLLGASAGIILGMVSFELIPESLELAESAGIEHWIPMMGFVIGFFLIHVLERTILMHHAHEDEYASHTHPHMGKAQSAAIIGHAFFDGLAIGLSFLVSDAVGISVALAVLAHDFCDGLNTVSFMVRHGNSKKQTVLFLVATAVAPLLGGVLSMVVHVPDVILPVVLGWFAGVLLYIAAADVLPEAHAKHSGWKTIAMTAVGVIVSFLIIMTIGH